MHPETQYAKSGDVHIAYQVIGEGPLDLVFVPGFVSHLEENWNSTTKERFFRRLASFSRLILFDKRGTGLSDRSSELFTLEQRMDDVRAVMDAVGSERAALFGISEGGPMSILFAATYPERSHALVMYGTYAKRAWSVDHPYGWKSEKWDKFFHNVENYWGTPSGIDLDIWAPSVAQDDYARQQVAKFMRLAASPGAVKAIMSMNREIDVREILPTVHTPTLIAHRVGDRNIDIRQARYISEHIPNARLLELPGDDHMLWIGDNDALLGEIEEFLTGVRHEHESERVLLTVLFTDIVKSTEQANGMGDKKWRNLLARHNELIREQLKRFRGDEVATTGDGFFAVFDGPARAIRCGKSIQKAITEMGIAIRVGLHTGECEVLESGYAGIAVHIGSRVMQYASPQEVLVTSTVKDLVAGSGLEFIDQGVHTLKGVPNKWHLYAAR